MQRELETARRIQLSLLPRTLPEHPGLDIAARFVPMTAVAGDIYDVVSLGSGSIGLFVADVSEHGIPAALVASMVKIAFAAEAGRGDDPEPSYRHEPGALPAPGTCLRDGGLRGREHRAPDADDCDGRAPAAAAAPAG